MCAEREAAVNWPTYSLSIDQGGDGWSAVQFLQQVSNCAIMVAKDLSHRLWNDCLLALADAGLKPLMLILTVVLNSDHGPWSEARWLQEANEAVRGYICEADEECHVFRHFVHRILADLNWEDRMEEPGLPKEVFDKLPESVSHKCSKISQSRWFDFFDTLNQF